MLTRSGDPLGAAPRAVDASAAIPDAPAAIPDALAAIPPELPPMPPLRPVRAHDIGTPAIRETARRKVYLRHADFRRRWYYAPLVVVMTAAIILTGLYLDQTVAQVLVWPTKGAEFTELYPEAATAAPHRDRMVIVAGGLNTKSGAVVARALGPSLRGGNSRVFSLIYGSGIYDGDIDAKFDLLYEKYKPTDIVMFGSSMGGNVLLNLAQHFQQTVGDPKKYTDGAVPPKISTIFLDSTPLGPQDVRDAERTKADVITSLTEALNTDGGAVTRIMAEMLVTWRQWSDGRFPLVHISPPDFFYKLRAIIRNKVNFAGISTQLLSDQYGVIRRFRAKNVLATIDPDTRIVYFRPADPLDDRTIKVGHVQQELAGYADEMHLQVTVIPILGGSHAAASYLPDEYNLAIDDYRAWLGATRQAGCAGPPGGLSVWQASTPC